VLRLFCSEKRSDPQSPGVESHQRSQVFPIVMGEPAITPISVAANLNRINLVYGVYLQDTWRITDRLSLDIGSRWDRVTGFTTNSQFSPTINFVYKPRDNTTVHAGFARNFQVPTFRTFHRASSNCSRVRRAPMAPARAATLLLIRKPTTPGTLDSPIN
jgi:outer membrane receptor for monomeric catechols